MTFQTEQEFLLPTLVKGLLKNQLEQTIEFVPHILRGYDIDAVHKTRVGFRRIRSQLRSLKPIFQKKILRFLRSESQKFGSLLGEVRDLDVFKLGFETYFIQSFPEIDFDTHIWQPFFLKSYQQKYFNLTQVLHNKDFTDFINFFEKFCTDTNLGIKKSLLENRTQISRPEEFIKSKLFQHAKQVEDSFEYVSTQKEDTAFHKLRIDSKRFRYTLEFFAPVLAEGPTQDLLTSLTEIQDHLGAINDFVTAYFILDRTNFRFYDEHNSTIKLIFQEYKSTINKEKIKFQDTFQLTWNSYTNKQPLKLLGESLDNIFR